MSMSPNRRIFLNIVATYGRSLYAIIIGLFCGRWSLMALGEVDYGLLGVVGGLTAFISFFNGLLASAIGRFYAVSIGKAKVDNCSQEALETCRMWFSLAVLIHTVVPIILMVIGYPLGVGVVRNFLTIPPDRIEACVWVFRFVCASCFISMVNVPFMAMYTAKQYIAELTVYSFITTTLNVFYLYYMITHPGDWLAHMAFWTCLLAIIPQIIIAIRAIFIFPECRFRLSYCRDFAKLREIASYAWWRTFGSLGFLFRSQGIAILINKFLGPRFNASLAVATNVESKTNMLSSAMIGAFSPAITTAYGAGELDKMKSMSYRSCKFGLLLLLVFLLPLSVELPYVIKLWLKNPPAYVVGLCWCVMLSDFIEKSTIGQAIAVNATGKIAAYQTILGFFNLLVLPFAWLFLVLWKHVYFVGLAMVLSMAAFAWGRLWFSWKILGFSTSYWLYKIMMPICFIIMVVVGFSVILQNVLTPSFLRFAFSSIFVEILFLIMSWFFVLDRDEKDIVVKFIKKTLGGIWHRK